MTCGMATIIEATSLSSVTSIATNPPPHPNAPSDIPKLPLVLYIARVPGSRDVFLTPMKPREKVVSAEDVQSSLYYIHINCEEDLQSACQPHSSANSDAGQLPSMCDNEIKRKPVLPTRLRPTLPPYPLDDGLMPSYHSQPPSPPQRKQIARKPVNDTSRSSRTATQQVDLPVLRPRRLPSPPHEELPYEASLHSNNVRLLHHTDNSSENNPYLREYPPSDPSFDQTHLPPPGSLTLIRRDPSSNEQWNVALIHDPPIHEISSAALRNPTAAARTKRGGAPLYLDISNPGYEKFLDGEDERAGSRISSSSTSSSESDPPPEGVFRRRLYMPGCQLSEHSYRHSRLGSNDSEDSIPRHHPHRSSAAIDDRRHKGYTFTSPWSGRCEFSTGTTGKSLTCRHTLPSHHQPNRFPLSSSEVSELRFNLPTSSRTAEAVKSKPRSYFHGHDRTHQLSGERHDGKNDGWDSPRSSMFTMGEDGKMDLTLGQERAGGGFGGKQAKLGKLIIQPAGLEMLDLLVAANMGLWWRAYERY
ncbi:hypothetical protein TI39_contig375g00001 [Zymoseptoria brevis]|uniref:Oxidoreductase-like protein n=1 Tax=Zymoseptoria brevis TaxID=1047168 RepID=A0A0F4GPT4_9PEZI|nr:hypothetical protein TI39_contig375g00001 [Zymoseptoria brevis]